MYDPLLRARVCCVLFTVRIYATIHCKRRGLNSGLHWSCTNQCCFMTKRQRHEDRVKYVCGRLRVVVCA